MPYVGGLVQLCGLQVRDDLNGRVGEVTGICTERGWPVRLLGGGGGVLVKMKNVADVNWGETGGLVKDKHAAGKFFATHQRPLQKPLTEAEKAELVRIGRYGEHAGPMAWGDVCRRLKVENGGDYPSDWYEAVILGGLFPDSKPAHFLVGGEELFVES